MKTKWLFYLIASTMITALLTGCEREIVTEGDDSNALASFVGSDACQTCHVDIYADFIESGHPYKLNEVHGAAPEYPLSEVQSPPSSVGGWDDVAYVIGGYGWKARFIDHDGYIITEGGSNQYNLIDGSWTDYHADEEKPYDCGSCHTTGYNDDPDRHEGGLPGIIGEWEFPGIHCEECHGPGGNHVEGPFNVQMTVDRTSGQCGQCHIRGGVGEIPASGGFIKHHEQFNEMMASRHAALQCVDCHDPHKSARYSAAGAIKIDCESCHWEEAQSFANTSIDEHLESPFGPDCVACHMPMATKSALAADTYVGDTKTHLFAINTDSTAEMFYDDGSKANPYLTLEYTCLQCHTGETKIWAAENAGDVHEN